MTETKPMESLLLEGKVIEALRKVYDPEIPVNIYELGLVYDVVVEEGGIVTVRMTMTSPMCPVVQSMPADIENRIRKIRGVTEAKVELVWEPAWNPEMMSESARLELGFF